MEEDRDRDRERERWNEIKIWRKIKREKAMRIHSSVNIFPLLTNLKINYFVLIVLSFFIYFFVSQEPSFHVN